MSNYMKAGSLIVSHITTLTTTWISLALLLTLHLSLNYTAVRSVQMTTLNRQRANIVFSTLLGSDPALPLAFFSGLLPSGGGVAQDKEQEHERELKREKETRKWKILTPVECAQREAIFERDGVLRWYTPRSSMATYLGHGYIGISMHQFLTSSSSSMMQPTSILGELSTLFSAESYLLHVSKEKDETKKWTASILLKASCTPLSQLKAWIHALIVMRALSSSFSFSPPLHLEDGEGSGQLLRVLGRTLDFLNQEGRFERYTGALREAGWDLGTAALETKVGRRVSTC